MAVNFNQLLRRQSSREMVTRQFSRDVEARMEMNAMGIFFFWIFVKNFHSLSLAGIKWKKKYFFFDFTKFYKFLIGDACHGRRIHYSGESFKIRQRSRSEVCTIKINYIFRYGRNTRFWLLQYLKEVLTKIKFGPTIEWSF